MEHDESGPRPDDIAAEMHREGVDGMEASRDDFGCELWRAGGGCREIVMGDGGAGLEALEAGTLSSLQF